LQKKIEEIRKSQGKLLVKNVKYSWDNLPYYKQKMKEADVKPEDIKLHSLLEEIIIWYPTIGINLKV